MYKSKITLEITRDKKIKIIDPISEVGNLGKVDCYILKYGLPEEVKQKVLQSGIGYHRATATIDYKDIVIDVLKPQATIDLDAWEKEVDAILANETKESMTKWLEENNIPYNREENMIDLDKMSKEVLGNSDLTSNIKDDLIFAINNTSIDHRVYKNILQLPYLENKYVEIWPSPYKTIIVEWELGEENYLQIDVGIDQCSYFWEFTDNSGSVNLVSIEHAINDLSLLLRELHRME